MSIKDFENQATFFRREALRRIAEAYSDGFVPETLDRIPHEQLPDRGKDQNYRCCVYMDREVFKYRCLSALGIHLKDVEDDFLPISHYAAVARERTRIAGPFLSVLDIACHACVQAEYVISNVCHGCVARPCMVNCPKDCITIENRQARIDPERCISCGKCQAVCPYHAVVRVPIPCQEACPVEAIARNRETDKQRIDFEKCIACGQCMRVCPFGAILEVSQIVDVLRAIDGERETVAICAPAIVGQFDGGLPAIAAGLKALGFDRVVEVAHGADRTCQDEAREFAERIKAHGEAFMTTSCCPAYVMAAKRHLPDLLPHISETPTPMHTMAEEVKRETPEATTVFIGPCVAKRYEGLHDPTVDFVLTFEELEALFDARDIDTASFSENACDARDDAHAEGRGFAITGGVAGALRAASAHNESIRIATINGLDRKGMAQLKASLKGHPPGNVIEVMTCTGGCVGGAGVCQRPDKATNAVKAFAGESESLF